MVYKCPHEKLCSIYKESAIWNAFTMEQNKRQVDLGCMIIIVIDNTYLAISGIAFLMFIT